jgi:glyoxylate reductase
LHVVVTRKLPGPAIGRLRDAGHSVWVFEEGLSESSGQPIPRPLLLEKVARADGLLPLLTDRIDAKLLSAAPSLQVVANYAVGFDNIDVDACRSAQVIATNTPDVLTEATADQAWALMLATARRVVEGHTWVANGLFDGWKPEMLLGRSVHGRTLGIVGGGRIGRAVAKRAFGFSMRVLMCDPNPWDEGQRWNVQNADLSTLLRESDFITLHTPLNAQTKHLINAKTLAQMKTTAMLINTARGGLVDESALFDALRNSTIAGAGLDVFDPEPPRSDNPLLALPQVVVAPHLGSATIQAREAMANLAVDNLLAVLGGKPPLTPIT